ncbi:GDP-mannose 4,6-dehydratase [Daldinia eschscholtzii]|nr:GDP-mannose 4,6-dehydratase [Daldinia eschscholtzii]
MENHCLPTALITGFGGQDGSYLCELLLQKGHIVHGILRHRRSRLFVHFGDILDPYFILNILKSQSFDEIYHLAAQSHVGASFDMPFYTCDVNALGTVRIIQAILTLGLQGCVKFYNACTSEVFGQVDTLKQNESSLFNPISPYAAAKAFSFWITRSARESHGLFAVNGILFNHESPRRGLHFVTRKISYGVALIYLGKAESITLGNLDSSRDWGSAQDYMKATGETRSVRDFATIAFKVAGTDIQLILSWNGSGSEELGVDAETKQVRVRVDEQLYRAVDVPCLLGDATKATETLNWKPQTTFHVCQRKLTRR